MREFSLHILDVVMNSVEAGADLIEIEIDEDVKENVMRFSVRDNGRGMDEDFVKKVTNPFVTSRKTRNIGLGLPLLKATCERCGGELIINSQPGKGTYIDAHLKYNHIDRPPIGKIADTILALIISNISIDFVYKHIYGGQEFSLDTRELKKVLKEVPLNSPEIVAWLKDYIIEGLSNVNGGDKYPYTK